MVFTADSDAANLKHVVGEIDAEKDNGHRSILASVGSGLRLSNSIGSPSAHEEKPSVVGGAAWGCPFHSLRAQKMFDLTPYAAPLIGLFGTLTVAGIGLYQWRRQHSNPNRSAIADSRRKAAETIWSKLEEMNLELRSTSDTSSVDPTLLTKELNTVFLKNSMYLDDKTQAVVREYLEALLAANRAMSAEACIEAEEWGRTNIGIGSSSSKDIEPLLVAVDQKRESVKAALLHAAGA